MPANGTKANISDLIIHHLPGDGNGLFGSKSPGSCDDRSGLSGLARFGGFVRYRAGIGGAPVLILIVLVVFNGLRRLLDREMQHTFVEMSYNSFFFGLKR